MAKKVPFEKSKADKDMPWIKEGSPKDMAMDKKQKKAAGYAKGGKCMVTGGKVRGMGAATKGGGFKNGQC